MSGVCVAIIVHADVIIKASQRLQQMALPWSAAVAVQSSSMITREPGPAFRTM